MMTYETRGFIDDLVDKRKKHKDLTIRYEMEKYNLIVCMFSIDDREYDRREKALKRIEEELEQLEKVFEEVHDGYKYVLDM